MATKTRSNSSIKTYKMVLSAIMIALATVLSLFAVIQFPFGGSVTVFSMVPIVLISWLYGVPWGLVTGFVFALTQMACGMSNYLVSGASLYYYLILVLFDYVIAFTAIGLGGLFKNVIKNPKISLPLGGLVATFARFLSHFVSGFTIWGSYAEDSSVTGRLIYSLTYNMSYMGPEMIITALGCFILAVYLVPHLDENGMIQSGKKA